MTERHTFSRKCIFCGNTILEEVISDDGRDWLGHARGSSSSTVEVQKCSCQLGKLVDSVNTIKPMCVNCINYRGEQCTSKEQISELNELISKYTTLSLDSGRFAPKDPTTRCNHHRLDPKIFVALIDPENSSDIKRGLDYVTTEDD